MGAKPREPQRLEIARSMIEAAANAGLPCPTNEAICERIKASSPATGARVVSALEAMGLISVQRFHQSRIATVIATGRRTAGNPGKPHKRAQWGGTRSGAGRSIKPVLPTEVPMVRVSRNPCPRCGVRADLGCGHGNPRFVTVMGL